MKEIPGSEFEIETELVLLAMGFIHPDHEGMLTDLGVELDARGNVKIGADRMTSIPGIFAAGDMSRGQSLVVWAIAEGREAAHYMDKYLVGTTRLAQVPSLVPRLHLPQRTYDQASEANSSVTVPDSTTDF